PASWVCAWEDTPPCPTMQHPCPCRLHFLSMNFLSAQAIAAHPRFAGHSPGGSAPCGGAVILAIDVPMIRIVARYSSLWRKSDADTARTIGPGGGGGRGSAGLRGC